MKTEIEVRELVAKNLIIYRKKAGLTQLELANKLNYSDKAVSKWERGESLPDLYVLSQLAELYGIKVDQLMEEKIIETKKVTSKRAIILLSVSIAWVVVTLTFIVLLLIPAIKPWAWISFIYGILASFIIYLVLAAIYRMKKHVFIAEIGIIIFVPLAACFTVMPFDFNLWPLMIITAPLILMALLWTFRKKPTRKIAD